MCSSPDRRVYVLNHVCVKAYERVPTCRQTCTRHSSRKQRLPEPGSELLPGLAVGHGRALNADLDAAMKASRLSHLTNRGLIKQMPTMPAYAAKRQHRGEIIGDAKWPALIQPDSWENLQAIMSLPERKRTNDWPPRHLLPTSLCVVRVGLLCESASRTPDGGRSR
jgi:hypothetical protein